MPNLLLAVASPTPQTVVPPLLFGALAVYLLLPRPRPYPRLLGAAAGVIALGLAGVFLFDLAGGELLETILFVIFSVLAVGGGVLMIAQRNPAYAALSFALVVLSTCGLFLLQAAPFLMASTVIIYAGAIIVTFLFVLMLAQREGPSDADDRSREPELATLAGFVLLGAILAVLKLTYDTQPLRDALAKFQDSAQRAAQEETPEAMVKELGPQYFRNLYFAADQALPRSEQIEKKDEVDGAQEPHDEGIFSADLRALRDGLSQGDYQPEREWNAGRKKGGPEGAEMMRRALTQVQNDLRRINALMGGQPPDALVRLSDLSGPPPNTAIRWNDRGEAPLPADNVGAVGRSLFTDYLLAVELGGTLLLVATIGAIVIAHRGGERRP
jgi:NADH:ubiquinone oxidoreductase subunit 6 (subunit J)